MKPSFFLFAFLVCTLHSCTDPDNQTPDPSFRLQDYLDFSLRDDQFTGGTHEVFEGFDGYLPSEGLNQFMKDVEAEKF